MTQRGESAVLLDLTPREHQALTFIADHIDTVGYAPSIRQLGDGLGVTSSATVHDILRRLAAKGAVRRDAGVPRGIVLLRMPDTTRGGAAL